MEPQDLLELWLDYADAPTSQPSCRRVASGVRVDDLKAAWLSGEPAVRTSHWCILLLRAADARDEAALNPRLTLREVGLRSGDTLWVKLRPPGACTSCARARVRRLTRVLPTCLARLPVAVTPVAAVAAAAPALSEALGALSLGKSVADSWAAFVQGRLTHDTSRSTLALPSGCTWFGDCSIGSTLYVRRCYEPLARRVLSARNKRCVVLGTPGVGKTMFGLFFIWRLLRDRAASAGGGGGGGVVVYQSFDGLCTVLHIAQPPAVYQPTSAHVAQLLLRSDTFYVVDGRAPEAAQCPTLLITPPKRAVWAKWMTQHHAARLVAPAFTLQELLECRAACYPDVSEARARALHARWGGSARFVLAQSSEEEQRVLTAELAALLRACDLTTVFETIRMADSGADEVPHRVVHMLAVDDAFVDFTLGFASDYMADRVVCALVSRAAAAVRRFIAVAAPAAHMSALRGHLFEGVALAALAAGARARVRRLPPPDEARSPPIAAAEEEEEEALPARHVFEYGSVQQFADDAPLGALGRPVSGSQATWDALALDAGRLTLFQVTISAPERHGISAAGLRDLGPLLHAHSVRLAFVVPPERFEAAARAVRIKDAPEWASTRLEQVVMTLADDAFDGAVRSACAEAADAAQAVDAAAMPRHVTEQTAAPRKRRAAAALLPAGGGSP